MNKVSVTLYFSRDKHAKSFVDWFERNGNLDDSLVIDSGSCIILTTHGESRDGESDGATSFRVVQEWFAV